jgi:glycosyltransferase involved in cell wall biosynthesis/peptidoglycan/xylan/chitin deacetylase (PgdA/CDA1 family)
MRILFFINLLSAGGKERRLVELLKVLKFRQDCEFELVVMNTEIHYKEVLSLNIPIHYLIRRSKKDISVFRMFYKICRNYKPDIVHCWDSMTAIYSSPVCKLLKIKLVNGLITSSPEKQNILNKDWFRAKITFPFADIVISNSKAGLEAFDAPSKKSFFVHNGFNFERINNIIDPKIINAQLNIKTKYLIGMVATNSKNKDYLTYFAAAQILLKKRKDITFLAIGENTDSEFLKSQIDEQYIENIRLLGKKSGVESYINALDICVLSTFTEGISNSILEYMALGKPVIATAGGGTNEIVIDQETGFLINRSNPGELAEKIEILLNDNELRGKMGAAGKARIDTYFTIDDMVKNYVILYNNILYKRSSKKIFFAKKFLREVLAFFLIQLYYLRRHDIDGILSFYFHNPSKALFEKIMKWLIDNEYKFISIKELDYFIHHKVSTKKLVFICFDDGWRGNISLLESIEKHKIPVTLFVQTDAVNEGNFWWEYALINGQQKYSGIDEIPEFKGLPDRILKEKISILKTKFILKRSSITLEELKKINKSELVTIGSHTITHPILTNCSYESQSYELMESKRILGQWLNREIEYIAYPNGDYNDDTIEIAEKCGYKLGFTTNPGKIETDKVNPLMIPRNALYDSGGYFENISKILGAWQEYFFKNK